MPTVKIRDNGTGIPTDVRDISNPFFTSHHAYGDAETKRLTKPIDFTIVRDEIDMRVGYAA